MGTSHVKEKHKKTYNQIISELQNEKRGTRKTGPQHDVAAVDSAPDIIISHDGESIYETIDGKRSLRYKPAGLAVTSPENDVPPTSNDSPLDRTYDHLDHFRVSKNKTSGTQGANSPLLAGRPETQARGDGLPPPAGKKKEPRPGQTSGSSSGARGSPGRRDTSSPQSKRSSCTSSSSSQGSSSGRRIVCQVTMVGVVENGRPVPIKQPAASNTYFFLESVEDGEDSLTEDSSGIHLAPHGKFRIREDKSLTAHAANLPERASDYFILEPLDEQQDVSDMFSTVSPQEGQTVGQDSPGPMQDAWSRCSLHGQNSISSFRGLVEGQKQQRQYRFRDSRIRSCPEDSSPDDTPSTPSSPPLRSRDFRRSLSSPYPRQPEIVSGNVSSTRDRKLDPAFLQARIQQEMLALGLAHNSTSSTATSNHQNNAKKGSASCWNDDYTEPELANTPRGAPRPGNEYFILEPDAASADSDEDVSTAVPVKPTFSFSQDRRAEDRGKKARASPEHADPQGRHRYQRQQSHGIAPRLPRRNQGAATQHKRSKSETPLFSPANAVSHFEDDGQGPVIVSLKKSKSTEDKVVPDVTTARPEDEGEESVSGTPSRKGSFRPRIKSAPSKTSVND
nr:hypothetical protein BaRGS_026203 [Batillaria attramentaria]